MNRLVSGVRSGKLVKVVMCFAALAFLLVFYGLAVHNTPETEAVMATDFQAGRIIDDAVFYNANTMTVEEIQAFLDEKLPTCDMWGTGSSAGRVVSETGYVMPAGSTNADYARLRAAAGNSRYHEPPYVCVNKYYENPETHETLYETNGIVKDGMISAAQIIYNEAHNYNINPQVLLVLLKKESYVWGDTWPLKWEYNSAMGYGCPDTAPCDTAYYGFYNQVHMAAYQFDRYKQKNYEYNYHPGMVNNIYYSPTYSCGTKQVYIENMATASLYIYTPYTPNDAALQNYPGTSYCGSYGNRNFFMYFSEWFGSTLESIENADYTPGIYQIKLIGKDNIILGVDGNSFKNGDKLTFGEFNSESGNFSLKKNSDGTYTLINTVSDLAIDIPNAIATNGVVLQQWEQNGTNAQKWYLVKRDDGFNFVSVINTDLAISYDKNSNSPTLGKLYADNDNQVFLFASEYESVDSVENEQLVEDGVYQIRSAINKNLSLDVAGNQINNSTNVQVFNANGTSAQEFRVSYDEPTGTYKIIGVASGRAIDVVGANTVDGSNVQIFDANNTCAQKWKIVSDGEYFTFLNGCSGKALDVSGGRDVNGTNVQIFSNNNTKAQKWILYSDNLADGDYEIRSLKNDNLVLDVDGAKFIDGNNVQIFSRNNTVAQIWNLKYYSDGDYFMIRASDSSKYLSLKDANPVDKNNIRLWYDAGTCGQKWKITKNLDSSYTIASTCNFEKVIDISGGVFRSSTNVWLYGENSTDAQKWVFSKK